jgi:CxxC motif-containing protein (DUF1111 family)
MSARRAPIPVFGAGFVEAIADETLLALEDPFDRDGNGVSGRAGIVTDVATGERRVGRFGWKAQQATLLAFAGDAYRNEMGITNDLFPKEFAFGMSEEQIKHCDLRPDPEDEDLLATAARQLEAFCGSLAGCCPRTGRRGWSATARRIFDAIGCTACHVPALLTDRTRILFSTGRACRFSRISCCTTSEPGTGSSRPRRRRRR